MTKPVRNVTNVEIAIPTWRWFVTKRGLSVLVSILALAVSFTFNLIQLRRASAAEARDFETAGSFRSGELLDSIIAECTPQAGATPIPPLRIVSDFANYGAFSHPDKFAAYLNVLGQRADRGKNDISFVVLDEARRREVMRLQFKDFDALIKTAPFREKLGRYIASDYGRRAMEARGLRQKAGEPEKLTIEEFVDVGIQFDNLVIADLRKWGVQVKFYPYLLTVHAWSGSRNNAVMALVDFEGVVDEVGFVTRGQIAENLQRIFEIVDKGSRP